MSSPAIEVQDLFKSYGRFDAVKGISFRVDTGEVFALLGANGAGKTSTLEILEGHRRRSGGQVTVLGFDPEDGHRRMRERIGIVLQSAGIEAELTVREVLDVYARCYPAPLDVADAIAIVGLEAKARARVRQLSGGQRRRLDLALALIGDPDLIFLDEPTIGLDPVARRGAWEIVEQLRGLGRTIVLTSHYMEEVQRLADRAVILVAGRIVAAGSTRGLLGPEPQPALISFQLPATAQVSLPARLQRLLVSRGGRLELRTTEPTRVLAELCGWAAREQGIELRGLEVTRPSLEDVFLQLTQEGEHAAR